MLSPIGSVGPCRRRRTAAAPIDSFFISEVDRDKLVLAGSPLETFETP
jgi:hypothetical protein